MKYEWNKTGLSFDNGIYDTFKAELVDSPNGVRFETSTPFNMPDLRLKSQDWFSTYLEISWLCPLFKTTST